MRIKYLELMRSCKIAQPKEDEGSEVSVRIGESSSKVMNF